MSNNAYIVLKSLLDNIANAIRAKTGKTETMTVDEMPTEIEGIKTGANVASVIPLTATANGTYEVPPNYDGYNPVTVKVSIKQVPLFFNLVNNTAKTVKLIYTIAYPDGDLAYREMTESGTDKVIAPFKILVMCEDGYLSYEGSKWYTPTAPEGIEYSAEKYTGDKSRTRLAPNAMAFSVYASCTKVELNIKVDPVERKLTITKNGEYASETSVEAYNKIIANVPVTEFDNGETLEVTGNGVIDTVINGKYYPKINVNVPSDDGGYNPNGETLDIHGNGEYSTIVDDKFYSKVNVAIDTSDKFTPTGSAATLRANGTHTIADYEGNTFPETVIVDVPTTNSNRETLEITGNGEYSTTDADGNYYPKVNVAMDMSGYYFSTGSAATLRKNGEFTITNELEQTFTPNVVVDVPVTEFSNGETLEIHGNGEFDTVDSNGKYYPKINVVIDTSDKFTPSGGSATLRTNGTHTIADYVGQTFPETVIVDVPTSNIPSIDVIITAPAGTTIQYNKHNETGMTTITGGGTITITKSQFFIINSDTALNTDGIDGVDLITTAMNGGTYVYIYKHINTGNGDCYLALTI